MQTGILLGGGISRHGKLMSDSLHRVELAMRLMEAGEISHLVLSGTNSGKSSEITEAQLYYQVLKDFRMPLDNVFLEEFSKDTFGNAVYAKKLILEEGLPSDVVVITNPFHMRRALKVFKHIFGDGFKVVGKGARTRKRPTVRRSLKEPFYDIYSRFLMWTIPKGDHAHAERVLRERLPPYRK